MKCLYCERPRRFKKTCGDPVCQQKLHHELVRALWRKDGARIYHRRKVREAALA